VNDEKRTEVDWQDLRIFLALGRHGSLSAAARALGVNHATIARRLHSLEDSLGEKLVESRPEGFALTLAGTHALAVAGDMDAHLTCWVAQGGMARRRAWFASTRHPE
jgi:molybdate transport repressor ModE-like protein